MDSDAVFSDCGKYRYQLTRVWDLDAPRLAFVGLNPSTADAVADDPTIRRVIRFARDHGFGSVAVVNLFALRSTDPRGLLDTVDPVGPDTDAWIEHSIAEAAEVWVGWGAIRSCFRDRATAVLNVLADVRCLGTTKNGRPRHPLYLPASTRSEPFVRSGERYSIKM